MSHPNSPRASRAESLTLEHGGEILSRYDDVRLVEDTGELRSVGRPKVFGASRALPQPRLFPLGEAGWLKALKLEGYAPRRPRGPTALQEALFPYAEAL